MNEYLQNLQQYVISNEAGIIRKSVYDFMIIASIIKHGGSMYRLHVDKIIEHVEKYFKLTDTSIQITQSIHSLVKNKRLIEYEKSSYHVTQYEYDKFMIDEKNTKNLETDIVANINNFLIDHLPKKNQKIINQLTDNILILLDKIFEEHGNYAARLFSNSQNLHNLSSYPGFSKLFQNIILSDVNSDMHNNLRNIMYDFFANPTEKLTKYLFSRAMSYVIPRVINADPTFKKISAQSFMNKTIVIDTNVIIPLITEDAKLFSPISTLLINLKKLKIKLIILEETHDEFIDVLDSCSNNWSKNRYKDNKNPFYDAYVNHKIKNSKITPNDFLDKFRNIEYVIEHTHNVKIVPSHMEKDTIHDELCSEINNAALNTGYTGKTKKRQLHDAICLEYVRNQRRIVSIDETGPSCWFLTRDEGLRTATHNHYGRSTILTISVPVLLHVITPFLTGTFKDNVTEEAFSKLISVNFIANNTNDRDVDKLLEVIPIEDDIPEDVIKKIIGNKVVKKIISDLNTIEKEKNPKKLNDKKIELQKNYDKLMGDEIRQHRERIDSQQSEINEQNEMIKKQQSEINGQNNTINKQSTQIDQLDLKFNKLENMTKFHTKKSNIIYILILIFGYGIIGAVINHLDEYQDYTPLYFGIVGVFIGIPLSIWINQIRHLRTDNSKK